LYYLIKQSLYFERDIISAKGEVLGENAKKSYPYYTILNHPLFKMYHLIVAKGGRGGAPKVFLKNRGKTICS
jgi:hypothetical protein